MTSLLVLITATTGQLVAQEDIPCQPALWSTSPKADVSDRASFELAYTGVECLLQSAAEAGAEWLKTRDLLSSAKLEADEENWQKASQLLESAGFQAKAALKQSAHEAEAWKRRVVGYKD